MLQNGYKTRIQEVSQMTPFYSPEGLRTLLRDRKRELIGEAERERQVRKARRPAEPAEPTPLAAHGKPETEWGPWLQGGEPLHLSPAGPGLT